MALLNSKETKSLQKRFKTLDKPVKIINFTQEIECQYCRETRQLLETVADLSGKLSLQTFNYQLESQNAQEFKIDKIPATIIMAEKDVGIRFYGIPSGYEFASLLESIELISTGKSPLRKETLEKIKSIDKDVHIQVFVTPTCPYCPGAVATGHTFAYSNDHITSDMVEITEFPHLATKYGVMGVPRVVINEDIHFEGALGEKDYLDHVLKAI